MLFFRIHKYFKYLLIAKHRKGLGIHSPFVYDLVSRVFRNKINKNIVLMIEGIREKNMSDLRIINVMDHGTGSVKMKSNTRKVSEIAKHSSIPCKYGILLSNMAAEFGNPAIIEFGTSLGISTLYMASSVPDNPVYTLEGCPETSAIANENFGAAGLKNVKLMNGKFDDLLPGIADEAIKPGLVFIDGDHSKEALLRYFTKIKSLSDGKTVIIIDDIHHSAEMEEAWNEIKRSDNVSVTIDIYRMGFVFFLKGRSRSDYVVRY